MEEPNKNTLNGFSPVSTTPVFWKSRKRSASVKNIIMDPPTTTTTTMENKLEKMEQKEEEEEEEEEPAAIDTDTDMKQEESNTPVILSEKRKALFEPLEPITTVNGRRPSNESLLPPPDFDAASYPKGWLIGKKRKLVNVDVVESMRRIAVQEMNRKDREIDGLNEQLDEDSRVLEHLQIQLLEERSKRTEIERENAMLQNQITMLMDMLQENEPVDEDEKEQEQEP